MRRFWIAVLWTGCWACGGDGTAAPAAAQQIHAAAPQTVVSDAFFERFATSFAYRGRNFFFNNIGPAPLPFAGGGFGAGGGASLGWRSGGWSFGFSALQGSNRSIVSQTPSLTVANGASGSFQSGVVRPFVTGWTPVVGEASWVNPVDLSLARLQQQGESLTLSGAAPAERFRAPAEEEQEPAATAGDEAGGLSLAELRERARQSRRADEEEAQRWTALAAKAEREGKPAVARMFLERAQRARRR